MCGEHPAAVAGWWCGACERALCPDCAASGIGDVVVCARCGHLTPELRVPRAHARPFRQVWPQLLASLVQWRAVVHCLIAAIVVQWFVTFNLRWWLLGRALELGWVLYLARRAGVGFDPFGAPSYSDLGSVWVGPLPRWMAGVGPVLVAAAWLSGFGHQVVPLSSPWPWLLAGLAVALGPPTLVSASVEGSGRGVVWPWQVKALITSLGADMKPLFVAGVAVVGGELIDGALPAFSLDDTRLEVRVVQTFIPRLVSVWALGVLGVLAGTLLRTRAGELGHGEPEEDLVPRLTEAPAGRSTPPVTARAEQEASRARRHAPIEIEDARAVVAQAVARNDLDAALAVLKRKDTTLDALEASVVVAVAQLLAGRGGFVEAAQVLRGVIARPAGPDAPRALVILARLCVERLGAAEEGMALYRRVVAEHPGTPAAEFAAGQLQAARR